MTEAWSEYDVEQVIRLTESLDRSSFDFLEVRVGDLAVTIGKGEPPARTSAAAPPVAAPAPAPLPAPAQVPAAAPVPPPAPVPSVAPVPPPAPVPSAAPVPAPAVAPAAGSVPVTTPVMGIFYAQPEPDAAPYVTVGAQVEEDTTVALVEVMKTFNAVAAGVRGTVVEVCVQNGQLVEYDEVLYRIQPAAQG